MFKKSMLAGLLLFGAMAVSAQMTMTKYFSWDDNFLPIANPGGLSLQYSGCWGMAVNGHEYAVLGGAGHILIFDVTNPTQTFLRNKFAGTAVTIWREFKSYKNHLYAVSDGAGEGLMIFDFSQAPDTIKRTYWSTEFNNDAHTITLDTVSGHIYLNGGSSGQGVTILDVSQNPDQPTILAKIPQLPGGYMHDSYVRNDTLYGSSGNNGYYIYDFKTDILNPKLITSTSTGGYNHNSWLTLDGKYAYYTEEIPQGRPIQIVDLTNLTTTGEIETVGNGFIDFQVPGGTQAVAHNVYVKGNLLFNSQYEDGLLVYDISNPVAPVLAWKYDTHPENQVYNGYFGNWGNYPWLPSGTIIAGDMQNGLFVLGLATSGADEAAKLATDVAVYPNPAHSVLYVAAKTTDNWNYRILDINGKVVRSGNGVAANVVTVPVNDLTPGVYCTEIISENGSAAVKKFVKN